MLEELRIRDLGVIDEAAVELGPGFTVVTGETGAGKTMVVTALGLLLGGRSDSGAVRSGAAQARVEGRLRVASDGEVAARVENAGGELDDGALILARMVSAEGRSRAAAGGSGVPAGLLAEIADDLVVVHGQSDQQRLLQPSRQRACLDAFGGAPLLAARDRFRELFDRVAAVEAELAEVTSHRRERAQEADLLRFGIAEVDAVAPEPGEDETLLAEETRLAHVDALGVAAEAARQALTGDESDLDAPDALGLVAAARKALEAEQAHDPALEALADRLASASYALADCAADLAGYASGLDTDPLRLAAVQERRAALAGLTRKYGETLAEVQRWRDDAGRRLGDLDDDDSRVESLRSELDALLAERADVAADLSARRTKAAAELSKRVTKELAGLAMPDAALTVAVTGLDIPVRDGADEVAFLLAAHAGAEPRPVQRGASGGELSRVMLAVEVCLAGSQPVPTMIFDEVDAGVGGKAAVEIGRRLARLARSVQVVVVTHLPQVAAFADQHFAVVKSSDGRVTTSGVRLLDEAGRRTELSRMLAGLEDSDTGLAHADELVALAAAERAG
jgi:DNA repair protein RecN (Recombination protein N)